MLYYWYMISVAKCLTVFIVHFYVSVSIFAQGVWLGSVNGDFQLSQIIFWYHHNTVSMMSDKILHLRPWSEYIYRLLISFMLRPAFSDQKSQLFLIMVSVNIPTQHPWVTYCNNCPHPRMWKLVKTHIKSKCPIPLGGDIDRYALLCYGLANDFMTLMAIWHFTVLLTWAVSFSYQWSTVPQCEEAVNYRDVNGQTTIIGQPHCM